MAFRSAGTLMTEFNATFVPPALMPGYKGHVPGVASSFGSSYGNTTFKYFQDLRRTGLEKSYALLSGGRFPTIFSPNSPLVLTDQSQNWDLWLHQPTYSRFNLDNGRITELNHFYKASSE
ncbi:ciliary microtubule inner protein 2C isoform X1 [Rattus norvegicus]|uniref:ciliary microtubule inner protein 2C isoform X1 n=1 Tax=Rattus norvegicus TaxID=10116 RepID=UPI001917711F|nr:protein FAM166C isoform X1 [Rattus norvegicus]